jgi:tetratricopeptide (TPR) repeat protein
MPQREKKQPNTTLAALIAEYGFSHEGLAAEVNKVAGAVYGKAFACGDREVRRWVAGQVKWPWTPYLLALSEIFGRPPEAMGFVPRGKSSGLPQPPQRPTASPCEEPVQRRSFLAASAAITVIKALGIDETPVSGRLAMTDVERIEATIGRLDIHFNAVGGGPLLQVALAYADLLRRAIGGCTYGARVEKALHRAVSALYSSAGLAARDCEQHDQAARLYTAALQSALLAGDPRSQARAWCDLAAQARIEGRHKEAVQITGAALDNRAVRRDARVAALLYARLAIGQAHTGDRTGVDRSLIATERAYDRVGADAPPPWLAVVAEAELSGLMGIAHQALGQYARAEQATVQALELMEPSLRRNRAYYGVQLAELQLAQGRRYDASVTAATIDSAAIDSPRIVERLGVLHRTLEGRP